MGKKLTNCQLSEANSNKSQSLIMLECVRSNLIAVIGYELWNPLSTIQVCLESLANEPVMPPEAKQLILDTALEDIKYLHQLIEGCVTFSNVELDHQKTQGDLLKLQTSSQQILRNTILRILQLNSVETDSDSIAEIVNDFVDRDIIVSDTQEEILEHIRNNLIAIVGHEIRTPLCTIEVCLESLSNEPQMPTEYRQQMLNIALNDIGRLQKLIKDFFILDRLEKGQVFYRSKYVRVREVVDLALDSLKACKDCPSFPRIVVEIPPQLPLVKVDEDILVEALIKLLDNADKFTKSQGEIKIQAQVVTTKTASHVTKNNTNVMLEVIISDNGRGIVPNHLEAIFNCFYQEEDSLRRTVNGTGIGLTICRHIINSLGGKIWANSAGKDRGSSIHFTLPVAV